MFTRDQRSFETEAGLPCGSPGLPTHLPQLFPKFVAQRSVTLDRCSRDTEFLAGRLCARAALAELCGGAMDISLPIGDSGAPVWPRGFIGSISHAAGLVSAVVAPAARARGIGFDIEAITPESTARTILDDLATVEETTLAQDGHSEIAPGVTALFSLKEAVFKCLYPIVRTYFDFRDVTVESLDLKSGRARVRLVSPVLTGQLGEIVLDGRVAVSGGIIFAGVLLPNEPAAALMPASEGRFRATTTACN